MARRVHEMLNADEGGEAILLTGRARPYDRDEIWREWKPWIGVGREQEFEKPIFVVATQCIEVGANIDFDGLVTEIASIDALEQRFGPLNRDGNRALSHAVIVGHRDQTAAKFEDPIYGASITHTWKWLKGRSVKETRTEIVPAEGRKKPKTRKVAEEFVPMSVLDLRNALRQTEERERLTMPRAHAPILMPSHVDLLCQTSPEPAVGPEPSVFLHGPQTGPADIQVVWRADLSDDSPDPCWIDMAVLCPPSVAEALALPLWAVRQWMGKGAQTDLADLEGTEVAGSERNVEQSGSTGRALRWAGADDCEVIQFVDDIRPGMTIVVPAKRGGCDKWGWNPESKAPVKDIGDQVKLRMGRPTLRLAQTVTVQWNDEGLAERFRKAGSVAEIRSILEDGACDGAAEWVKGAVRALRDSRVLKAVETPWQPEDWAAIFGRTPFDQSSFDSSYTVELPLDDHLRVCAEWAKTFAQPLTKPLRDTAVRSAEVHDIGKADRRFQAWLRGGNPVRPRELIAKSRRSAQNSLAIEQARILAGYPKGGRHELMSVALLADRVREFAGLDFDLLLHLIASHHGRCRPFAPAVPDAEPVTVKFGDWSASSAHGLESAGSGVCERWLATYSPVRVVWAGVSRDRAQTGGPKAERRRNAGFAGSGPCLISNFPESTAATYLRFLRRSEPYA